MIRLTVTEQGNSSTFRKREGRNFYGVTGDFDGNNIKIQYSHDGTSWSDCKDSNGSVVFTSNDGAWIDLPGFSMRINVAGGGASPNLQVYESDGYTDD